jgi:alpha-L-arabinofuranosidase
MGRPGVEVVAADVLDGLHYLTDDGDTAWGALRGKHGRLEPFQVTPDSSSEITPN